MIHKFQNIHGICYTVPPELKNFKQEFEDLIHKIIEDKKFPFTDVYVKIPVYFYQRFSEILRELGFNYKEAASRNGIFLIKF
jgi:hypothetical protein